MTSVKLPLVILPSFVVISALAGCASMGRLSTPSGRPEITLPKAYLKHATVAITSYNLNKGREIDLAQSNKLVTYEAVKSSDGNQQVTGKFVYNIVPKEDSVVITSQRLVTDDLDDDDADEDAAQPSFDAQQQELQQIAITVLGQAADDEDKTPPNAAASDHGQ